MFYIIGLGLSDEKDITIRGLEVRLSLQYTQRRDPNPLSLGNQILNTRLSRSLHVHPHDQSTQAGSYPQTEPSPSKSRHTFYFYQ
jgi:hypothetical protein